LLYVSDIMKEHIIDSAKILEYIYQKNNSVSLRELENSFPCLEENCIRNILTLLICSTSICVKIRNEEECGVNDWLQSKYWIDKGAKFQLRFLANFYSEIMYPPYSREEYHDY